MDITITFTNEEYLIMRKALADHYHIWQVEEDIKYLKQIDALESKLLKAKYLVKVERPSK